MCVVATVLGGGACNDAEPKAYPHTNDGGASPKTSGGARTGGDGETSSGGRGNPTGGAKSTGGSLSQSASCPPGTVGPGVQAEYPAQRAQYVWITEEEAETIRATESPFEPELALPYATEIGDFLALPSDKQLGDTGHALLSVLAERFHRPLLGWPAPWAAYGTKLAPADATHLLRVEYSDDAIVIAFDGESLIAYDGLNNRVGLQDVLDAPERIASVYFATTTLVGTPASCNSLAWDSNPKLERAYLLGNSRTVRRWSVQSAKGQVRFEADLKALNELFLAQRQEPNWGTSAAESAQRLWCFHGASDCSEEYLSTLTASSRAFDLTTTHLASLLDDLRALPPSDVAFDWTQTSYGGAGGAGGEAGGM
jgi:hypothetical protein